MYICISTWEFLVSEWSRGATRKDARRRSAGFDSYVASRTSLFFASLVVFGPPREVDRTALRVAKHASRRSVIFDRHRARIYISRTNEQHQGFKGAQSASSFPVSFSFHRPLPDVLSTRARARVLYIS